MLASMFGQWAVCRVESQRAFGGVLLVEDGDGLFPRGELGIVDLAQIKDMALNRASGSTATFHDAPVSVDLPVLLASMAAQEHRPTSYPEIREPRQGGRSALQRKSLVEGGQRVDFSSKTAGRLAQISKNRRPVAKVRLVKIQKSEHRTLSKRRYGNRCLQKTKKGRLSPPL